MSATSEQLDPLTSPARCSHCHRLATATATAVDLSGSRTLCENEEHAADGSLRPAQRWQVVVVQLALQAIGCRKFRHASHTCPA